MTTPEFTLRLATVADAAAVADFEERTFRETFGLYNRPEDMDAYCSTAYGLAQQRRELEDPRRFTLLAEHGGDIAGIAQLLSGPVPDCVTEPSPIELLRFYVDRPWHGRGLSPRMMSAVSTAAEEREARTLYLGVWERNARAIAFYTKQGFRDVGSRPFILGADHQTDRIMLRPLSRR